MRKFLTTSVFIVAALMMTVAPAAAGRYWCRSDPVVSFNGTAVQVWVELPRAYEHLVNGPIQVAITTPEGVESAVLFTDDGFNGYGEEIAFDTRRTSSTERDWNRHHPYWGAELDQMHTFMVAFEVSVPLDQERLEAEFGKSSNAVPVRLRIVDGRDFEQVVGGSAAGVKISVAVHSD